MVVPGQRTDSFEKTLVLRKIEGRRRRGRQRMRVGWYHQLDGHEFEYAPGVGDGQGSQVCCSPWDFSGKNTGVAFRSPTSDLTQTDKTVSEQGLWDVYKEISAWVGVERPELGKESKG